jgi:hypothetical protein
MDLFVSCNSLLALMLDKDKAEIFVSIVGMIAIFGISIAISVGSVDSVLETSGGFSSVINTVSFTSTAIE